MDMYDIFFTTRKNLDNHRTNIITTGTTDKLLLAEDIGKAKALVSITGINPAAWHTLEQWLYHDKSLGELVEWKNVEHIIAENDKLKKLNVELLESLLNLVVCPAFNSKVFASDELSHTAWTVARYVVDKARVEEEQHA